jgi:patatin-like phospholipase/acyl hydrolase
LSSHPETPFRVLSLDGGGAKGFYTLGVLKEVEAQIGEPLYRRFDLVYGTSTGAIIAALICLGKTTDEILELYKSHVVKIMANWLPGSKTAALMSLARDVFGDDTFSAVRTRIGIVAARWVEERPMIFKSDLGQAFGQKATFEPGFGAKVGEAVAASCSAHPFFKRFKLQTSHGRVELVDGGYCANNPALYSLTDATGSLGVLRNNIRLLSVGVGQYPAPRKPIWSADWWFSKFWLVQLLQKTFEFSTTSMEQLRAVTFPDVQTVRINEAYTEPQMATDMFEHDLDKLDVLWQRGRQSYAKHEAAVRQLLL